MKTLPALSYALRACIVLPVALANAPAQPLTAINIGSQSASGVEPLSDFAVHLLGTIHSNRRALWAAGQPSLVSGAEAALLPVIPSPGYYPGDLSNPSQRVTVQTAQQHGFYINAEPSTWGMPANFLNDLSKSDFIHITDQYVAVTSSNRYPVGLEALGIGPLPHILFDADIASLVHLIASFVGGIGYDHIYHLYLPPGQDVCSGKAPPSVCYSPDMPNTFAFCAYHGSVTFNDIGHILFTVEPYQNVPGCAVHQPSPNGPVVDSTADVLSHETFETITDPDLNAWFNRVSLDLFGAEIGDECQNVTFNYGSVAINGKEYEVQPEYANNLHGCAFSPFVNLLTTILL
jgi:hypothetical protein